MARVRAFRTVLHGDKAAYLIDIEDPDSKHYPSILMVPSNMRMTLIF